MPTGFQSHGCARFVGMQATVIPTVTPRVRLLRVLHLHPHPVKRCCLTKRVNQSCRHVVALIVWDEALQNIDV